ncbi:MULTISPECIES: hypothetical protein [unclassified Streptomyces]|uniref:hypothetical protein n=1 Tax=unclassified Streptomyces TaxID=2593676 RepID=UPI0029A268E0|nr:MULTISPECIES: hypothetical protein [unclassified Streptomyces]MDX3771177.1 hypothetical protein [Streptomyces sp. AK08-01B]
MSRTLTRKLRTGRPLSKKRRRPDQRVPRFVAPAVLIDRRPSIIELRERLDDWGGGPVVAHAVNPPSPRPSTDAPAMSA